MGITRHTALSIQGNDDIQEDGKFAGLITHGKSHNYRILISTQNVYDTSKEAGEAMQVIVDQIKAMSIEEIMK